MELQKRSSDFGRSISQTASEDGTELYRPKTELVPYSDVDCMYIQRLNNELVRYSDSSLPFCP